MGILCAENRLWSVVLTNLHVLIKGISKEFNIQKNKMNLFLEWMYVLAPPQKKMLCHPETFSLNNVLLPPSDETKVCRARPHHLVRLPPLHSSQLLRWLQRKLRGIRDVCGGEQVTPGRQAGRQAGRYTKNKRHRTFTSTSL